MKKLAHSTLLMALMLLTNHVAFADNQPLTVKEQLEIVNKCWKDKHFTDPFLQEKTQITDEIVLIQTHLALVEQKLREKNTSSLSAAQKQNRNNCLAILHDYWVKGVFPKNTYHQERTPYFIDNWGTACAVGHLIIETGHESMAKKVSQENNYAYIKTLNEIYPELTTWADSFGFTVEELAWIQPGYPLCDTSCTVTIELSVIDTQGTVPPYTYLWSPTGDTTPSVSGVCPGTVHSCIVLDANSDTVPSANMVTSYGSVGSFGNVFPGTNIVGVDTAPNAFYLTLSSTPDSGGCTGTVAVAITNNQGELLNLYADWWLIGQPSVPQDSTTNLCAGTYGVSVSSSGCYKSATIVVSSVVSNLKKMKEKHLISAFPNPFHDKLTIELPKENFRSAHLELKNSLGQSVFYMEKEKLVHLDKSPLDLSFVPAGIYWLSITVDDERNTLKLIKQ